MKNLMLLVVCFFTFQSINAQGIIEREYSSYLEKEEVTHVFVSGKLFDMASTIASGVDDEEIKELSEFASKIQSFNLIKVPAPVDAMGEYKKGIASLSNEYEELVRVRDGKDRVAILIDEEDNIVYELIGLIAADDEFVAFSLIGEMDLSKVSEIVNMADRGDAFKSLKRVDDISFEEVKVYPNPTTPGSLLNINTPENMVDGELTIYDINGSKIKSQVIDNTEMTLDTDNMKGGTYIAEMHKDGITVKRTFIVAQ